MSEYTDEEQEFVDALIDFELLPLQYPNIVVNDIIPTAEAVTVIADNNKALFVIAMTDDDGNHANVSYILIVDEDGELYIETEIEYVED